MNDLSIVIKEQLTNWRIIFRLSSYQEKANYQSHYLGMLWQVLNPLIQVGTYFIIFGLALKGNRQPIDGAPYLVWLLFGMSVWFWINSSVTQASQSVFSQIGLVSKLKFPVSIMPTTAVV
ncbi:MAG: Teichoic acid translocation permease TagG, partial [Streptococcaceae bacterium]|nr:Teichoic acid translocation permease TagG [Streptococcaceae bacterium]